MDLGQERHMKELVHILKNTRQHLMTGVSHMIPFVVSGGILLAVSVMLYGKGAVPDAATDPNLKKLFDIGVAGLTLMVPFWPPISAIPLPNVLRWLPAPLRPGSATASAPVSSAPYRRDPRRDCGLVPEKTAGAKVLRSVMPIFIIPIIGTFITAGIMMWGLGEPVGALTAGLTQWLQGCSRAASWCWPSLWA
jgi:fructose-specific PTS system IIC-like component